MLIGRSRAPTISWRAGWVARQRRSVGNPRAWFWRPWRCCRNCSRLRATSTSCRPCGRRCSGASRPQSPRLLTWWRAVGRAASIWRMEATAKSKTPQAHPPQEYVSLVPGKRHFRCDRLVATLSVDACLVAQAARRCACDRCPVGAFHASESGVDAGGASSWIDGLSCVRCGRLPGHVTRPRLVGGLVCVSCFNRARESRVGHNAKGRPPKKTSVIRFAVGVITAECDWLLSFEIGLGRELDSFGEVERAVLRVWPQQEAKPELIAWHVPDDHVDAAHRAFDLNGRTGQRERRGSAVNVRRASAACTVGWRLLETI